VTDKLTQAPSPGLGRPAVDSRPYFAALARYRTPASKRTAYYALKAWARVMGIEDPAAVPWWVLRYEHWVVLWERMAECGCSPATFNLRRSALFGLLEECWKAKAGSPPLDLDELRRIRTLRPASGESLPRGRHVEHSEIRRILSEVNIRDRALLAVLYGTGIRRAEVVTVDLSDLSLPERADSEVGGEIRVTGKGNKRRRIPLPAGTTSSIREWLELRGGMPGPLFVATDTRAGGRPVPGCRRLSNAAINAIMKRIEKRMKLEKLTPHDFRRTYAGEVLDDGTDLSTLQKLLGHSQVTTTQRYDRRGRRAADEAAARFSVPVPEK
jgi:integrase/recombinase XerD